MKIKPIWYFPIIVLALLLLLFTFRLFSAREIDDVTPGIQCDQELLDKSDILYVIPKFENQTITKEWCNQILALNKTLELHGVTHSYKEFDTTRDEAYLEEGIQIFKDCFGFEPEKFKPPQLAISKENKILVDNRLERKGWPNQVLHKVYHCNDSAWPRNSFMDWF